MRISDFIICDDIRFEQLNKVSLMGLYNDRIAITVPEKKSIKWPLVMSLGLYVRVESVEKKIPSDFNFKISFLMNDKELGGLQGSGKPASPSVAVVPAKVPQFPITESGILKFVFSMKDASDAEISSYTHVITVEVLEGDLK